MDNLRSAKERCFQLWHQKKNRLEQNLQLRLFEQDCDRVSTITPVKICPTIKIPQGSY